MTFWHSYGEMIRIRRSSRGDLDGFAFGYVVLLIFVIYFDHACAADAYATASLSRTNVTTERIEAIAGSDIDLYCKSILPNCSHEWSFSSLSESDTSLLSRDSISVTLNYYHRRTFANFIIEREGKLKIRELAAGNTGVYTCTSRLGEKLISRTEWIVNVTKVTVKLWRARSNRPYSGCSLLLYCQVEGGGGRSASVPVQWTKNGEPLERLAEFQQRVAVTTYTLDYDTFDTIHSISFLPKFVPTVNNKLLIHSIDKDDEAVYGCRRTDISHIGFDFMEVLIQPSERLEINGTIVSDDEIYFVRSKVDSWVAALLAQRFYWRSVKSLSADRVLNFVENADVPEPRIVSDKVSSSSLSEKRMQFANKVARSNFADNQQVEKFLDETVNNVPVGRESCTVDLSSRPDESRFEINTTSASGRSVIGCSSGRCSCVLEHSYEVTILTQSSSELPPEMASAVAPWNTSTSETVLIRLLTREYSETECACLYASLSTFTSYGNSASDYGRCELPLVPNSEVTTLRSLTVDQSVQANTHVETGRSEDNMMQVLIGALVGGFVVVFTVLIFVVSFLVRARKRLDAAVALRKTTRSDADADAETDAHKLLDYGLHMVQVHESAAHTAATRVCQLASAFDSDTHIGVQCNNRTPVGDGDKRTEAEAGEQDRAASSSSSGATTNTSCFCSTNASLDSHELPQFPIVRT